VAWCDLAAAAGLLSGFVALQTLDLLVPTLRCGAVAEFDKVVLKYTALAIEAPDTHRRCNPGQAQQQDNKENEQGSWQAKVLE
jgi:hypothetical protein